MTPTEMFLLCPSSCATTFTWLFVLASEAEAGGPKKVAQSLMSTLFETAWQELDQIKAKVSLRDHRREGQGKIPVAGMHEP